MNNNWTRISIGSQVFYIAEGTTITFQEGLVCFSSRHNEREVMWTQGIMYGGTISYLISNGCVLEDTVHTEESVPSFAVDQLQKSHPFIHQRIIDYLTLHPERFEEVYTSLDAPNKWILASNIMEEHDEGTLYHGELKGELKHILGKSIAEDCLRTFSGKIIIA